MSATKLFGNEIPPDCGYCSRNKAPEAEPDCDFSPSGRENGACPYFLYDPLLRKPKTLPPLRQFSPEEFSL